MRGGAPEHLANERRWLACQLEERPCGSSAPAQGTTRPRANHGRLLVALLVVAASGSCASDGAIGATAPVDCKGACQFWGRCTAMGGICRATDADCHASSWCKVIGYCHAVQGDCVPISESECAQSLPCAKDGYCGFSGQYCVATSAGCDGAGNAFYGGQCHERARADDTCDADRPGCKAWGECANVNGICLAGSEAVCQASSGCTDHGRCHLLGALCRATLSADCRNSTACKTSSYCVARDGICVTGSDADCAESELCSGYGLCHFKEGKCL